jgi:hypothetical protein
MAPGADPGIVDEDVNAAKLAAGGFSDLIGRGIVGQIHLNGEQLVGLSLLTSARCKRRQRLTISIDASDPNAGGQQAPHHRSADAASRAGYYRHSLVFAHSVLPPAELPTDLGRASAHRGRMPG